MAVDFSDFSPSSTIPTSAYFVGYEKNESGGERKWELSTLANAVSSIISPITTTNAAIKFNDFSSPAAAEANDWIVGYDTSVLGGERRWTVSTIANAVSGLIQPLTNSSFIGTGTQLLSSSGYQKLPGGLIIQWGNASTSTSGFATVTLNITFPNSIFLNSATDFTGGGGTSLAGNHVISTQGISNSQFYANASTITGAGVQTAFYWIAIGY